MELKPKDKAREYAREKGWWTTWDSQLLTKNQVLSLIDIALKAERERVNKVIDKEIRDKLEAHRLKQKLEELK